jgi:hypothetical protein
MLAALREQRLRNPDFRVGRLVVNTVNHKAPSPEIYCLGDDELLARPKKPFPANLVFSRLKWKIKRGLDRKAIC